MIPEPGHTELNFTDFIILLGVVQGFLLTIAGLFRPSRKEKFKALLFFSITCIIAEIFLNRTGYMYYVIPLVDFSEPLQFVVPPLIYLLVLSIDPKVNLKNWGLHFVPFVAYTIYFIPFYLAPNEFKAENYYFTHHVVEWKSTGHYELLRELGNFRRFQMFIWYFQATVYLVLSTQTLLHYRRTLNKLNLHHFEVKWWFVFNIVIAILIAVTLVVKMTYFRDIGDHIIATFLTGIVYCSTLTELSRPAILHHSNPLESPKEEPSRNFNSGLKEEKKAEIQQKLLEHMDEKKIYTDSLISVGKLSKLIGEPTYIISQVINETMEVSFYD